MGVTKYLVIAIVVLGALLASSVKLYLWKRDELTALEVKYVVQQKETEKANALVKSMEALHESQISRFTDLQKERTNDATRFQQEIRRINKARETSERAALQSPERFGRIATFNLLRGMRDVCRSGGGNPATCKIEIPKSPKANSSTADYPDIKDNDGVASRGREGPGETGGAGLSDPQR